MLDAIRIDGNSKDEAKTAYKFLKEYGKSAKYNFGRDWSELKVKHLSQYDDTDGSGMHPNRPGIDAIIHIKGPSGILYEALVPLDEDAHRNESEGYFVTDSYISQEIPTNPNNQPVYLDSLYEKISDFEEGNLSALEMLASLNKLAPLSSYNLDEKLPHYIITEGVLPTELYFFLTKEAKQNNCGLTVNGEVIVLDLNNSIEVDSGDDEVTGCPEWSESWIYTLERKNIGEREISLDMPVVEARSSLAKILGSFSFEDSVKKELFDKSNYTDMFDDYLWTSAEYIANTLRIPWE